MASHPQNKIAKKKGIFFSLDAVFALFIVLSLISLFSLLQFDTSSQELAMLSMHAQAGDAVDVLAKSTLEDVGHEPIADSLYAQQLFSPDDRNKTLLDIIGTLWATNDSQNISLSSNVSQLVQPLMAPNVHWAFLIDNDTVYNTSTLGDGKFVTGVSRRMASGYRLSEPVIGYVSRAYLSSILGRQASAYAFFGGFVGQGNLTHYVRDIPENATVTGLYAEFNLGSDAELYVNGVYCSDLLKTGGAFAVNNFTLDSCAVDIVPGTENEFALQFTSTNQSEHYVGGGFVRVTYNTEELAPPVPNVMRYNFPGIQGVINLFDSFYVPGNISTMNAHLHFRSDQIAFLNLGGARIMTAAGNASVQVIDINNTQLDSLLDYENLSSVTIPLRMGIIANDTGDANLSNADIIVITDVSGSMNWRIGFDDTVSGVIRACDDPALNQSDTQRLALAKCLDKTFIDIILNSTGPRVGLVAFSSSANSYESLTTDANYLKSRVDNYNANGGTCICCGINRAYNILNAESTPDRKKYIIVMTDGIAGYRCSSQGGWTIESSPTSNTLYGVNMYGENGQAVGSSGRIIRRNSGNWNIQSSPTSNTLYATDFWSSSSGFATGYNGRIVRWNGASWSTQSSPTSNDLFGVSMASSTLAFAVGESGRIVRWNGASWSTVSSPTSNHLQDVDMYDSSLGFAVGLNGRIIQWNGASWSTVSSPTSNDLYGVSIVSPTFAVAVGENGRTVHWNGASWNTVSDPTNNDLEGVEMFNTTLGFAVGQNGEITVWNGSDWDNDDSPTWSRLYSVSFSSDELAYGVGSSGRIVEWDSVVQCNGTSTTGTTVCSGNTADCNTGACTCAADNAVFSAERAYGYLPNTTIYSVGFGPVQDCTLAANTLQAIADAGNGTYFHSDEPSDLIEIYALLASTILNQSFSGQVTVITGNISTELYPDSYIEVTFDPETPTLGYREIIVPIETPRFSSCEGSFTVPGAFNVSDIRVTSYSSQYWTDNVSVQSPATGGSYEQQFKLSNFGSLYQGLGDPFIVQFPASKITSNATNNIYISTGYAPSNSSPTCSADNRAIYNARFAASVPYGPVLSTLQGRNLTVYYDLNHDGVSDGVSYVSYGEGLPGFDPTPTDVSDMDTENNALDEAFMRLLDKLNFIVPAGNSGLPGSNNNPVDVQLSSEVGVQVNSLSEVPYMWGPVDMGIAIWR